MPALVPLSLMTSLYLLNCIFKSRDVARADSHDCPCGLCCAVVVSQGPGWPVTGAAARAAPRDGPSQSSCSPDPSLHETQGDELGESTRVRAQAWGSGHWLLFREESLHGGAEQRGEEPQDPRQHRLLLRLVISYSE